MLYICDMTPRFVISSSAGSLKKTIDRYQVNGTVLEEVQPSNWRVDKHPNRNIDFKGDNPFKGGE